MEYAGMPAMHHAPLIRSYQFAEGAGVSTLWLIRYQA